MASSTLFHGGEQEMSVEDLLKESEKKPKITIELAFNSKGLYPPMQTQQCTTHTSGTFIRYLRELEPFPEPKPVPSILIRRSDPPILDYSKYAVLLEAEQQMKAEADSKELGWRTTAMDLLYEQLVLEDFGDWVSPLLDHAKATSGSLGDMVFFRNLREEIETDLQEVEMEQRGFMRSPGMSKAQMIGLYKDFEHED